jgi:hypothetical protein
MNEINPYESPTSKGQATNINTEQRRLLNKILAYRKYGSTSRLFLLTWRFVFFVVFLLFAISVVLLCCLPEGQPNIIHLAIAFVAGMFVSFTMLLIPACMDRIRLWSVMEQIIDWNKVRELLGE